MCPQAICPILKHVSHINYLNCNCKDSCVTTSKSIHMDENIYLYHIYMLHTYCYMQLNVMCNLSYTITQSLQSLVTCVTCT